MDEKKLVQEALKDREAFSKIVDLYYKEIFGYIYKRTLDKEISKDLTQETFLKALKYLSSYKGKAPLTAWLLKIATNAINEHYRKEIDENIFLRENKKIHYPDQDNPEHQIDYELLRL